MKIKAMKKAIATLLAVLLVLAAPERAQAAEDAGKSDGGDAGGRMGTGDWKSTCTVTFHVTDETGGYPGKKIKAVMTDVTGTLEDEYTFTPANSWKGDSAPKYSMAAPATYSVAFEGVEDGYAVVNTLDYSPDVKFATAAHGSADVRWTIVSAGGAKADAGESRLLGSREASAENGEAEQAFQAFLDAVGFIEDDETWYNFLKIFKFTDGAKWYGKYVQGAKEEDYADMPLFDRFVWEETYLVFCHSINSGDRNYMLGSEEALRRRCMNPILNCMTGNNSEQVKEAYEAIVMWQFEYIQENGVPFNFISNRSYLDEIGKTEAAQIKATGSEPEISKEDRKELEDARKELMEEMDKEDIRAEKGGAAGALPRKLMAAGLIALLLAAAGIAIWRFKKGRQWR